MTGRVFRTEIWIDQKGLQMTNNLAISCSGNLFTKPLYCWSLLESIIVVLFIVVVYIEVILLAELWNRRHNG